MDPYNSFARGPSPVGVRTIEALDATRYRLFPCEVWYPATEQFQGQDVAPESQDAFSIPASGARRLQAAVRDAEARPGAYPLIVFSHPSASHRRAATFLCTHLASHGYVVAALDHSELVAKELQRKDGESDDEKWMRVDAVIAARVPDIGFAVDYLLGTPVLGAEAALDAESIGIVGHSFGGWTALAATDVEPRIRAIVALAPGGASRPRPGILPLSLAFDWARDVPTLFLVAEDDASLPLSGMHELFDRVPATKRMVILRRADHYHFMDNAAEVHEAVRAMPRTGGLAWLDEMRPFAELCSGDEAHLFVRGLALCHLDAALRQDQRARQFLEDGLEDALAASGIEAIVQPEADVKE
jgi:predicted dienelactone hydrolase